VFKKLLPLLLCTVLAVSLLSGCGKSAPTGGDADKKVKIRIASAFNEKTSMLRATQKFAELVKERSKGQIEVEIHPGGVMGGEKENLEAVKMGELEMAIFGTFPIVQLTPKYSFFDAPFVFRDKAHFYKVWEGKLGQEVRDEFKKQSIHTLGIMGRGYRHITSNNAINSVDDLKGIKMRMGQSKPFIDSFTQLGAVVVPIALPELFTSLKMGVVSSSDGPYDQIYTYKLHETQKYIAQTGHLYATSMWLMNDKFYNGLSKSQKDIIDKAAKEALVEGDKMTDQDEKDLLEKLKAAGMQFTKPDIKAFMEKAKPALEKLFKESWPVTTPDEINKM
jgi:TRAP-type transport system periplasmic protein